MNKILKVIAVVLAVAMLAIPVYAAFGADNFVPSISQKGAPKMLGFEDPTTGIVYPAVIVDEDGNIIRYITEDDIKIVPLSDADLETTTDHEERMLKWGYESLFEKNLWEVVENLEEEMERTGTDYTVEDMLVYELFHVTMTQEVINYLAQGYEVKIKLEQLNQDIAFEMVIHAIDTRAEWVDEEEDEEEGTDTESFKWEARPHDVLEYTDNEDERIISLSEGCLFALLTNKKD